MGGKCDLCTVLRIERAEVAAKHAVPKAEMTGEPRRPIEKDSYLIKDVNMRTSAVRDPEIP